MVKKKSPKSHFSKLAHQINTEPSSAEYHLIDNEYFVAFNSLDDIEQFHNKIIENQPINNEDDNNLHSEQDDNEMDMKTFAEQFLIDLPEPENPLRSETSSHDSQKRKQAIPENANMEISSKRQRRNIRDLPQSSSFIFMSDDDNANIFECLKEKKSSSSSSSSRSNRIVYEDMSSILLTLDVKQKKKKKHLVRNENEEPTISIELAEPSSIKNEPSDPEQLVITHVVEAKDEPVELNVIPTGPMGFGTSVFFGGLDNYVQNIHQSCSTNVSISSSTPSRSKRIRKRKKQFNEETELIIKPKKIRKKHIQTNIQSTLLTDAEIEQQFGERLPSVVIKSEQDQTQAIVDSRVVIEIEPVPQTPIEKARAKLTNALERGHAPDTFVLKIRSRESKMIEVQLAIYGTADWHSNRTKILSKIEEALRGLRVSWTKIDICVDQFDVQICTSPQADSMAPSAASTTTNSSSFLKTLSESGPLIVHIHDRRRPQQRHFIKCPCPQCSPKDQFIEPSLPIIVSVSPSKTPIRRLSPPTILRKTPQSFPSTISSLQNIHTRFFKDLIDQYGTNTITSITQCVLDLTLIVTVHSSLSNLHVPINYSTEEYRRIYQQIIDPLKYTILPKQLNTSLIEPDILTFYRTIKQTKANIRSAQSMRNLITLLFTPSVPSPPSTTHRGTLLMNRILKRSRNNDNNHPEIKQQAHFTPIIELKPILSGSTIPDDESINKKFTKIISTNTIQSNSQRVNTITTQEITPYLTNSARVIRLSIAKSSIPPTIRLVASNVNSSSINKIETSPLVPKQINIIKPLSITTAMKLSNPILISNKYQQPLK